MVERKQIEPEDEPRDVAPTREGVDLTSIFDLGNSGVSDIAVNKDLMIAEAFESVSAAEHSVRRSLASETARRCLDPLVRTHDD